MVVVEEEEEEDEEEASEDHPKMLRALMLHRAPASVIIAPELTFPRVPLTIDNDNPSRYHSSSTRYFLNQRSSTIAFLYSPASLKPLNSIIMADETTACVRIRAPSVSLN